MYHSHPILPLAFHNSDKVAPLAEIRRRAGALLVCIVTVGLVACSEASDGYLGESVAMASTADSLKGLPTNLGDTPVVAITSPANFEEVVTTKRRDTRSSATTADATTVVNKPSDTTGSATTVANKSSDTTGSATAGTKTSGGTVNSVDTIIGDMSLENDARLDGIPDFMWATGPKPAAVVMGADPRGCVMPQWWLGMPAVKAEYKDCDLWSTYIQWFVIFEGIGNAGYNVRVETRRPKSYYLSRTTGKWHLLGEHSGTSWFLARKSDLIGTDGPVDVRTGADGAVAIKVPVGSPYAHHGIWPLGKIDISSVVGDIAALFATVQARLVIDDPNRADDRANAVLLIQSGADYYPNASASVGDSLPPSAGLSRSKRVTSEWQAFNLATITAARQDSTSSSASIQTDAFRANPPPLE